MWPKAGKVESEGQTASAVGGDGGEGSAGNGIRCRGWRLSPKRHCRRGRRRWYRVWCRCLQRWGLSSSRGRRVAGRASPARSRTTRLSAGPGGAGGDAQDTPTEGTASFRPAQARAPAGQPSAAQGGSGGEGGSAFGGGLCNFPNATASFTAVTVNFSGNASGGGAGGSGGMGGHATGGNGISPLAAGMVASRLAAMAATAAPAAAVSAAASRRMVP